MSGPAPQPTLIPPAPRGAHAHAIRNGCVGLVLILLIGLAVVQMIAAARSPGGWDALGRATPAVLAEVTAQFAAGFIVALLVHRVMPRAGLWIVLALALVAMYPAVVRGYVRGWAWVPFALLLGLAALHAIPAALHDAAAVDRAQGWFKFRTITLPLVGPLLLGGVLFRTVDGHRPADVRTFVAAHLLLIGAIIAGSVLTRGRR